MKRKLLNTLSFLLIVFFVINIESCTGNRSLNKGNYDLAIKRSVKKLRKNPNNKKAKQTLIKAYNLAVKVKMEEIYRLKETSDMYKWEKIVDLYSNLNSISADIDHCPACLKIIPDANTYTTSLNEAKYNAATVRYNLGIEQLKLQTITSAQDAYRHFAKAKFYIENYKDIDKLMATALEAATIRVVMEHIPMHSQSLKLSNEFFESKIFEYINALKYDFVRFYSAEDAATYNIKPHQYILLRFDDFVVGQTNTYEKETEVSKDSVVLKTETLPDKTTKKIYGTVKANLHTYSLSITSTGLLDMRITDATSNTILVQQKMPGTYIWETKWANFNGDARALNNEQLNMTKQKPGVPPPPQQLFIEFTKPIYSQVTNHLNNYYKKFNL
ncbi:MAG: hypothetical protein HUU47_06995 [Bacteroidetes bacterium]|nr:hypothetical protein [Bacteroidota bacterium]